MQKYYLSHNDGIDWEEVTKKEYLKAQIDNEFLFDEPLSSWGRLDISGKVESVTKAPKKKRKSRSANS
jgi:hypothetical protein